MTPLSNNFDLPLLESTGRQLAEEIGSESASELFMCYLQDSPGRLEEMKRLLGVGDRKSLGILAHSIKGSSSIFGLSAMESLGHQLETESETGELERIGALIQELDREFKIAAPEILRISSELAAGA